MASELTYRSVNSAYLRLFFLGERSLGSGKLGDCDAVWRTTNVTQVDLVAKTDRVRIAAMLAADSHLQVPSGAPAFAGGYAHQRAARFESDYQCDALQALAWGEAPESGRLVYASAFSELAA